MTNRKTPLIALFGKRRTGKDTLGEVLQAVLAESRQQVVPIHRFDAPLAFLPVTHDRLDDLKSYLTARDDGYFVRLFSTRNALDDGSIITDGSRAIEYAWCRARGYLMVYLLCGDEERIRRGVDQDDLKTPAEIALDVLGIEAWDVVLTTDQQTIDECAADILDALSASTPTPPPSPPPSDPIGQAIGAAWLRDLQHPPVGTEFTVQVVRIDRPKSRIPTGSTTHEHEPDAADLRR